MHQSATVISNDSRHDIIQKLNIFLPQKTINIILSHNYCKKISFWIIFSIFFTYFQAYQKLSLVLLSFPFSNTMHLFLIYSHRLLSTRKIYNSVIFLSSSPLIIVMSTHTTFIFLSTTPYLTFFILSPNIIINFLYA